MTLSNEIIQKIEHLLEENRVILFMKGTPESPACGFSETVAALLVESGIYFESFDIYTDEELRQALKEYSSWPTYPQLYIEKQLIGGVDILMDMYES